MNKSQSKIFILAIARLFLLGIIPAIAQNNTSNPYSMYGLGELTTQTSPINSGMGNAGIGVSSKNYLNTINPAAYSSIDSLNFKFEVGVDSKYSTFKAPGESASTYDANFSYLALGWRINNWIAAGIGVNPYSTVGYEINLTENVGGTLVNYPLDIIGSGDISRAYLTLAISPLKNLSVGLKPSFLFGSLEQNQYHDLTNLSAGSISNVTTDYFHNFYFELGVQYTFHLNESNLTLGAIYTPEQYLTTTRENYTYNSGGLVFENTTETKDNFIIPEEYGIGLAYSNNKNFMYALDAGIQKWGNYDYDLDGVKLNDNPYLRTGIEFTPSKNKLAKFHKRISYRFGLRYAKSYLNLRDTQLDEKAITLGLSLPIRTNQKSHIDISFEAGQKGTLGNKLIQENYYKLKVGFSLNDLWFQKSEYN